MHTKLLIDGRKLLDGGIGVYISNLVDGLTQLKAAGLPIELGMFVAEPSEGMAREDWRAKISRWSSHVEFISDPTKKYSVDELLLWGRRRASVFNSFDIFHTPHYTLPFGLSIPAVATIHDAIHVSHPDSFFKAFVARRLISSALSRADACITVSEYSRVVLEDLFSANAVTVIPNALRNSFGRFDNRASSASSEGYVLCLGGERQHKGLDFLLDAWQQLKQSNPATPEQLWLAGLGYSDIAREEIADRGLSESVRLVGAVDEPSLKALYGGATAVVVSSVVEGFGLPVLEAMAAGVPVVSRELPSVREIAGSLAWYADTPSSFAGALAEVLNSDSRNLQSNSSLHPRLSEGVVRARQFSLEQFMREHCVLYDRVLLSRGYKSSLSADPCFSQAFSSPLQEQHSQEVGA